MDLRLIALVLVLYPKLLRGTVALLSSRVVLTSKDKERPAKSGRDYRDTHKHKDKVKPGSQDTPGNTRETVQVGK